MIVEYIWYAIPRRREVGFRRAYAEAAAILQPIRAACPTRSPRAWTSRPRFWSGSSGTSMSGSWRVSEDPAFADFFTLVRTYVDEIVEMHTCELHLVSPDLPEKGLPSLYEWAGGRAGMSRLINSFYDRVEQDELLRPFFPNGVSPAHRSHVMAWWSEVLGGPAQYTQMGGYPRMLAHHLDLNVTPEQRRRFVSLLSLAADDAGLPDDPEFRAAIVGYAEWATRLAMHNSQTGANVVREAPVPRWGWGVAPPYVG